MNKYYSIVKIIGKTNVGKSSLFNIIFSKKISITAKKKNLTLSDIINKYIDKEKTIFYTDTKGINDKKEVNYTNVIINYVIENNKISNYEINYINKLYLNNKIVIIINKIDKFNKIQIFNFINFLKQKIQFHHLIPISTKKNVNIEELKKINYNLTISTNPIDICNTYNIEQNQLEIFKEIIREKIFRNLGEEIPYKIKNISIDIKNKKKITFITCTIYVLKQHIKIIIGKNANMIKQISKSVRINIEKLIKKKIFIKIWIKK